MKYLCLSFMLLSATANAQLSDKQMKEMHDNTAKIESASAKLNEAMLNSQHTMDSLNMARFNEQNIRNLNAFMAERKVQEQKATKRMYWRLGFGLLMLIVLVVGWRRKKKLPTTS